MVALGAAGLVAGGQGRQARILRMFAAASSSAVEIGWAAIAADAAPGRLGEGLVGEGLVGGSSPLRPSMVFRKVTYCACRARLPQGRSWR